MTDPRDVRSRLDAATAGTAGRAAVHRICTLVPEFAGVDEAGVSLIAGPNLRTVLASTSPLAERLDWLQFELGEGPCLLAAQTGALVAGPDLERDPPEGWPTYAARACALDVRAVHGFPVPIGASISAAINLYRRTAGPLVAAGELSLQLIAGQMRKQIDAQAITTSPNEQVVHQAVGVLMESLGLGLDDALDRLRAQALVLDRPLDDVARDVVAGNLTLEP